MSHTIRLPLGERRLSVSTRVLAMLTELELWSSSDKGVLHDASGRRILSYYY